VEAKRREALAQHAARAQQALGGPMSEEQIRFLRDVQAFIDFAIQNGRTFASVLIALGHDANNLARYGFDLTMAEADFFTPMVAGCSELSPDDVGESPEP